MVDIKKIKLISEKCLTKNVKLIKLTEEIAKICNSDDIYWCKGTRREFASLCLKLVESKTFIKLNSKKRPNSFLCRSLSKISAYLSIKCLLAL
jgi:GTP-dependent phosphoenolpyruvate carboxykinase